MSNLISLIIYISAFVVSYAFCRTVSVCKMRGGVLSASQKRTIYLGIAVLIPAFVATFRTSGTDYYNYLGIYNDIHNGVQRDVEVLWILLNRVSNTPEMMYFISAFIFFGFSMGAIRKSCKNYQHIAWLLFLFIFFGPFLNGMRQHIAIAICAYSIRFIYEKKWFKFILFIIFAMLFHRTAFICFSFPVLIYLSRNICFYHLIILCIAILSPFCCGILVATLSRFGVFKEYLTIDLDFSSQYIFALIPPVILYYMFNIKNVYHQKTNDFFNLFVVMFIFQMSAFAMRWIDRLGHYFYFMIIFVMPNIAGTLNKSSRQSLLRMAVLYYALYFVYVFYIIGKDGIFPYIQSV